MKYLAFFSLFTLLNISEVHSTQSSCSPVELDKNNGPMSAVKVLDQGVTNTCYSHAGAVLLDAWLHSNGGDTAKQTEPYIAAMQTNYDFMSATLRNYSCEAIDRIIDNGSCNRNSYDFLTLLKIQVALDNLKDLYYQNPNRRLNQGARNDFRYRKQTQKNAELMMCHLQDVLPEVIQNKSMDDLLTITRATTKREYMQRLTELMCQDNITKISPAPKCLGDRRVRHGGQQKSLEYKMQIHHLLDKESPQPIGVGYCGKLLNEGKDYQGFKPGFAGFTSINVKDCGLHESVVIGRKIIDGKCHFKIRNSWGKFVDYHPDWRNNYDGNVWVDEDTLTSNMGSISYLE